MEIIDIGDTSSKCETGRGMEYFPVLVAIVDLFELIFHGNFVQ